VPRLADKGPDQDRLFSLAQEQDGLFTTAQAASAGISAPLLHHYVRTGRVLRLRRGVYRLAHYPAGDREDLAEMWLWSKREGVFSHLTALGLHDLSDALPNRIHLTLPPSWARRRILVPKGVVLHFADVPTNRRAWFGAVPLTDPARSLEDCAQSGVAPEILRQGAKEALRRGVVRRAELPAVSAALRPFGGIGR
jgi:predicted transcriptional regulator of viral defense system